MSPHDNPESTEDLKSLVTETLKKKGVLGKFKAQLRQTIISVLEEHEHIYMENTRAAQASSTAEGLLLADLIREYNEHYDLHYTTSVFTPEANLPAETKSRQQLASELHLKEPSGATPALPLLRHVLQFYLSHHTDAPQRGARDSLDMELEDAPVPPRGDNPTSSLFPKPAAAPTPKPPAPPLDDLQEEEADEYAEDFDQDAGGSPKDTPKAAEQGSGSFQSSGSKQPDLSPAPPPPKARTRSPSGNDGEDAGDDRLDSVSYSDVTATPSDVGDVNEKYSYVEDARGETGSDEDDDDAPITSATSKPKPPPSRSLAPAPAPDSDDDHF